MICREERTKLSSDATLMHISIMARESSEFDNQDIYIYMCIPDKQTTPDRCRRGGVPTTGDIIYDLSTVGRRGGGMSESDIVHDQR